MPYRYRLIQQQEVSRNYSGLKVALAAKFDNGFRGRGIHAEYINIKYVTAKIRQSNAPDSIALITALS
jgi:hypothetical protein